MAPTVATRRTKRLSLSGLAFAGSPYVRRLAGSCQTGTEALLHMAHMWASARATPWVALGLAATLSMLPLRFEAESRLMFEVGTQPPAAIVNGMAQLIGSRELAQDVVQRLNAEDVAKLASGSLFPFPVAPAQTDTAEAARKLRTSLTVEPVQGGRGLDIMVMGPTPGLSVRVAEAYMNAILELDSQTRAQASALHHMPLPAMRREGTATGSMIPDLPSPVILMLLAFGAGAVVIARRRQARMEPEVRGFVDPDELPREVNLPRRVIWVEDSASGEGLPLETAITRLEARLPCAENPQETGRIYLFSSQDHADETGRCALQFSRRLAERADVVAVFLADVATVADAFNNTAATEGLHDVLGGKADFTDVIRRDPKSRADIIRAGRAFTGPLSSGQERHLGTLLNVLQQAYEHVVVFAPNMDELPATVAKLEPAATCIVAAESPATAAVGDCDTLAALGLSPVVVMRLAIGPDMEKKAEDGLPLPTLDAVQRSHVALPAPCAHYGPGWPYPELVRAA